MPFQLPTQDEKAEYVLRQFNRIAGRYDLTNDAISLGMHRLWKDHAVNALSQGKAGKYLDVCCGTGDLTLLIAQKLSKESEVTGLDFSPNMLDVARQRQNKSRTDALSTIDWVQGDALALPFSDNSFDGAIISFGLRNLTDLQKGINEMSRVVKPGGRVVNLDLGRATTWPFAPMFHVFFRYVVPVIGQILQNDKAAYTYLPESLTTYPTPEGISELFQKASLINVQHRPLALGSVALHIGSVPPARVTS